MQSRLAVGCMSGTSLDGLDVALLRLSGSGLALSAQILSGARGEFDPDTLATLRALSQRAPVDAERISNAALRLALLHAQTIREALNHAGVDRPDLICAHGQTVFHAPPLSWQLFNPWPLARELKAPVVFDLRGSDLAHGGQGAPITPLADWILFRDPLATTVVNLGGFCNLTWLPPQSGDPDDAPLRAIIARDVCACNHVLDGVARDVLALPFDPAGSTAAKGSPDPAAVADLRLMLGRQSGADRSLGTGDEARGWITTWRNRLAPHDLARSATEAVAQTIAQSLPASDRVLLAGGGARHRVLAGRIAELAGAPETQTDVAGIPADYREAACMAVLGALCQDRVPITLPQVTGVQDAPVAGCWVMPGR